MSFVLPERSFIMVKLSIPKITPCAILYVKGMKIMVMKAGNPLLTSLKSIFPTELIINKPIIINAGAVAAAGTIKKIGAKKRASKNMMEVLTLVSPVRPPAATPEALSTYAVFGLVPNNAPAIVPIASAKRAF